MTWLYEIAEKSVIGDIENYKIILIKIVICQGDHAPWLRR
jgi:hypothetical protein